MTSVGAVTATDLRAAAEHPDELARVKKEWLTVPGQGAGVTWHYVEMLAGYLGSSRTG